MFGIEEWAIFAVIKTIWNKIPTKVKIGIILAIIGAAIAGGTFIYIKYKQHQVETLQTQLLQANMQIIVTQTKQRNQVEDIHHKNDLLKTLAEQQAASQISIENLRKKLASQKIGKLAKEKPSEAQIIVNRDSIYRSRCMEIAAGSPITPEELNAPKESRNTICPELFNYYKE